MSMIPDASIIDACGSKGGGGSRRRKPLRVVLFTQTKAPRRNQRFEDEIRRQVGSSFKLSKFGGAANRHAGQRSTREVYGELWEQAVDVLAVEKLELMFGNPQELVYFIKDVHEAGAQLLELNGGFDSTKCPGDWKAMGEYVMCEEDWKEFWANLPEPFY